MDFALTLIPYGTSEVENVYQYYRLNTWQRIPFRVAHLGLVVLGYQYLKRGRDSIFDSEDGAVAREVVIPFKMRF